MLGVLAPTQYSQAHSLAFPMEDFGLEMPLWEFGAYLWSETHFGHGVLQLHKPLHNFEKPASVSQQSHDTLST
jgi:hypothetical protein